VLEELTAKFRPTFPIPAPGGVQLVVGVGGSAQQSSVTRFLAKDRTSSVTVSPTNIVIETTDYEEYDQFRPMLATCLAALGAIRGAIVGLERVGLRYVNEVRIPGLINALEWTKYFAPNLIAPLGLMPDRSVAIMQAVVQSEPTDNMTTLIRYGALRGQVVSAAGPLRVAEVSPKDPFFMLDIDNSWTSSESYDEYAMEAGLDICDRLHTPIDTLFEAVITDQLRAVFRSAK